MARIVLRLRLLVRGSNRVGCRAWRQTEDRIRIERLFAVGRVVCSARRCCSRRSCSSRRRCSASAASRSASSRRACSRRISSSCSSASRFACSACRRSSSARSAIARRRASAASWRQFAHMSPEPSTAAPQPRQTVCCVRFPRINMNAVPPALATPPIARISHRVLDELSVAAAVVQPRRWFRPARPVRFPVPRPARRLRLISPWRRAPP